MSATLIDGRAVAERVRAEVEGLGIPHRAHRSEAVVTLSVGVAALGWGEGQTPRTLLAEADAALYRAKDLGRNRVVAQAASTAGATVAG